MTAAPCTQNGEDFRHDADRDLGGRLGADIESDGREDVSELFRSNSELGERIKDLLHLSPTADHAEIAHAAGAHRGVERLAVKIMIAADQHERFVTLPFPSGDELGRGGRGDPLLDRKSVV